MSNLISRQAEIDALERRLAEPSYQHNGEDWYVGMNSAVLEIETLPSVDRPNPKRSYPKESACDHSYWKYISKGEDDAEKECFCDLDDDYCFGKCACRARMKGADDE